MLSCSVIQPWKPMLCTWSASVGVGPKEACSRKRRAAAAEMDEPETPICTGYGADESGPFTTTRLPGPEVPANPVTFRLLVAETKVVGSDLPLSCTTDCATRFVPCTLKEKTPSGNVCGLMPVMAGGVL